MLVKNINAIPSFLAGDLTTIKEVLHPKNDEIKMSYSLAHATLAAGTASIPHILHGSEVYIILEGEGKVFIDDESKVLTVGDMVFIPPKAVQYIENIGSTDLKFICIVDPAWKEEEEEIL